MRFARLGPLGAERPVLLHGSTAYDLSPVTADIDGTFLSDGGPARAAAALAGGELAEIGTSGLRIGTPALATRGFGEEQFREVADIIATALAAGQNADVPALRARVSQLALDFPLYDGLESWGLLSREG